MKAAILYAPGTTPKYGDFADPIVQNDNHLLLNVKAAAVKNLDKGIASGQHYSSGTHTHEPRTLGMDGVGVLADGTRVYGFGVTGMIAEKGIIDKRRMVKIPAGLDDITAAALPNAVMGAGAAIHYRAKLQPGEVVLINGATGVTGMVAVQLAKHYGAKKVIVTGRNAESLHKLLSLGADEIISLKQDDEQIIKQVKELHASTPIDVVIDYIWGHPAELVLAALQGTGSTTHKVRYVTVGAMAGDKISLSSGTLRSSDIEISGSGLGSVNADDMKRLFTEMVPEMFQLAAAGKLKVETETLDLKDIETAWDKEIPSGKRLVIVV
ncbi:quinone oxidoreductase family protein [Mucilaginibacter sp. X5P1]|uniref:quinone oxidoreductase family protein n=1 Tax=Mucilaginibacter sp. X5P1 TaxID=2723088 RepID=UPI001613152C|nr:zinc-binding alcohol dehydrogenase family protein [Mucilaginibacter sp. X5P1]MBB6139154.1 NADPH:quinone reductase-like Zn-dependent oxidoreductase [Mucilaginibacter sp. X5P1]